MQQQLEYKVTPDREDLEPLNRELRFFPSTVKNPSVLSPAQVEQFNREGFLCPLPVYTPDEAARNREYFDRLLEEEIKRGGNSYTISSAHMKHAGVYDMLTDKRIVAYVSDLLGQDVVGWGAHFFCKMPGDGKRVDWHQDASYWPLTPSKTVTVWLAIDDADVENGCMDLVVGSHLFGAIEYQTSGADSTNVLNQTVTDPEKYGKIINAPVPAGSVSIHSDLLLHGSLPNNSTRRRCGLTLRYCPSDVSAYLQWNQKGVVVKGNADPVKWPGLKRPITQ